MRRLLTAALVACGAMAPWPARAHPHVWINAQAELVFEEGGRLAAIRHRWSFDPAYSTYVTQGLDKNGDGKLMPDELQELAKTNAENLSEYEYFTVLKGSGAKLGMGSPRDAAMAFEGDRLTLTFVLPLKSPAPSRLVTLEIYDPAYFVSFRLADGDDAVRLSAAPKGCAANVMRPKTEVAAQSQNLSETFFQALTAASNYGASFADRILVACP